MSGKFRGSAHKFVNNIMKLSIALPTSGEIPKQLIEKINDGKTIPIQKYHQAAILVVYDTKLQIALDVIL